MSYSRHLYLQGCILTFCRGYSHHVLTEGEVYLNHVYYYPLCRDTNKCPVLHIQFSSAFFDKKHKNKFSVFGHYTLIFCCFFLYSYYSGMIIQMSDVGNVTNAIWNNVIVNCVNLTFAIIGMGLVDAVGRRKLAIIGLLGNFFSLFFNVMKLKLLHLRLYKGCSKSSKPHQERRSIGEHFFGNSLPLSIVTLWTFGTLEQRVRCMCAYICVLAYIYIYICVCVCVCVCVYIEP